MWILHKVYINGTGHMTKMAAMLIYGKNLQTSNRPRYQVSVYRTIGPLVLFPSLNRFTISKKTMCKLVDICKAYITYLEYLYYKTGDY